MRHLSQGSAYSVLKRERLKKKMLEEKVRAQNIHPIDHTFWNLNN